MSADVEASTETGPIGAESPGGEAPPEPEVPESDPRDDAPRALLAELTSVLGAAAVLGSDVRRGDLWVRVGRDDWRRSVRACRDLGFDYFCFLSGIDWMPSTAPNPRAGVSDTIEGVEDEEGAVAEEPEVVAPDPAVSGVGDTGWATGYAGGDSRFQVFARLYSTTRHQGITLKADLDDESPSVETLLEEYPGADWNEREAWEMYGFDFVGHPHLVHLYLPGEFEGFPLRKDFPLLSREVKPWPGLVDVEPMPESADEAAEAVPVAADPAPSETAPSETGAND